MSMDRRHFLRLGLAASAGVAASGAMGALGYSMHGRHVARTTSNFHAHIDTVCGMCPAGCGIRAFVDHYGRLVMLTGLPGHPVNHGKICAKGVAAINMHYHPERLRNALAATRGRANEFHVRVQDDAVNEAAQLFEKARQDQALFVVDAEEEDLAPMEALLAGFGVEYEILCRPRIERQAMTANNRAAFGQPYVQADYDDADLILVFGANPFEGGRHYIAEAKALIDARVEGHARLVVFDPRNSYTAGRADQWVALKPGTDHIAVAAILQAIGKGQGVPAVSLADAAAVCGIGQAGLAEVADAIGRARKTAVCIGDGIYNGKQAQQTTLLLGHLQAAGKGKPFVASVESLLPEPSDRYRDDIGDVYETVVNADRKIMLITNRVNPVYEGYGKPMERALRNTSKVVGHLALSPFINETSRFADLVIPHKLPLEEWDVMPVEWHAATPMWSIRQPVAKAPGQVYSLHETVLALAEKLEVAGLEEQFGKDARERTSRLIKQKTGNALLEKVEAIVLSGEQSKSPIATLSPLKLDADSMKVPTDDPQTFRLIIHETNVMGGELARSKWLSEIAHLNPLRIHADDADRLEISQGDKVAVEIGQSKLIASADICESVRPGVISLAAGFGHEYSGKIAKGQSWRGKLDPDTVLIWWGEHGNGVNATALSDGNGLEVKVSKA